MEAAWFYQAASIVLKTLRHSPERGNPGSNVRNYILIQDLKKGAHTNGHLYLK